MLTLKRSKVERSKDHNKATQQLLSNCSVATSWYTLHWAYIKTHWEWNFATL